MTTFIAFARAINLGNTRRFGKDDLRRVTESVGASGVSTHLNTGNVRLELDLGPGRTTQVSELLEAAYLADRGFEVSTCVFTPEQLAGVVALADDLRTRFAPQAHYVQLLREQPSDAAQRDFVAAHPDGVFGPGERAVLGDRSVHMVLEGAFGTAKVPQSARLARLGVGTARNVTVLRTLSERWA